MEKNLPVGYKSQWDQDANEAQDDCGPTSVAMVLDFYGENLTTNQIYETEGKPVGLETVNTIQQAITKLGYGSDYFRDQSFEQLKSYIDKGIPVIVLVKAQFLTSRQDQNFKGGHFMVVVGYRADDSLYVNDPDFYQQFRSQGDHHVYTKDEFLKAWGSCYADGNPNNSFIVIYPKQGKTQTTIQTGKVITTKDLLGRATPQILDTNKVTSFAPGATLTILGKVPGDNVQGVSDWYEVQNLPGAPVFCWSGGIALDAAPAPSPKTAPTDVSNVVVPANADLISAFQSIYKIAKDVLIAQNALPVGETDTKPSGFWVAVKGALHI